jgi:hypothetical protein
MPEQLFKLTPNRDLQCYFQMPSAIAAISRSSPSGFTVSGKWRQQFDWAVVEWNRDNTIDHPALRYLPDGDLSGLKLTYEEERQGCIPIESNLVPVVDWNNLRIWATPEGGAEQVYTIPIASLATPIGGQYVPSSATMTLNASPGPGNRVGVAMLEQHYYYTVAEQDTLETIAAGLATGINGKASIPASPDFIATSDGPAVTITWTAGSANYWHAGANGNRVTVYGFAQGGATVWQEPAVSFSGGVFPSLYQITIDFAQLKASGIPTNNVRKLRWTWAADLQPGSFQQREFQVQISNWTVTGNNGLYYIAGPGSRRIEDDGSEVSYVGNWNTDTGNYSGGSIRWTQATGDHCSFSYQEANTHVLYLGTRLFGNGADVSVSIDEQPVSTVSTCRLIGEDVLVRRLLGTLAPGPHTITIQHQGPPGNILCVDFLEIVYPGSELPDFAPSTLSLATDWDTYHSQSLPPERTAWLIQKLGFMGRVNHYAGALWFYEIARPGTVYASLVVSFVPESYSGSPTVVLNITPAPTSANPTPPPTSISHLVLLDDTPETVAQAFAALINTGINAVWASASGNQLLLTARAMGRDGDGIQVALDQSSVGYSLQGGTTLTGGVDGNPYTLNVSDNLSATLIAAADYWRTDLSASPSINRAARDWHVAYFEALKAYGLDVVTSFSTELLNGDPDPATGLVQQYPDGTPVVLNTPSVQTNFSPITTEYWSQNYIGMASLQASAGLQPFLQFGEVQWWYYPNAVGMPFYDSYTQQQFQAKYGKSMALIASNTVDPGAFPNEMAFLPNVIGAYTAAIRSAVLAQFPNCRFEVLYPTDTNNTPLNQIVNYPGSDWTPANLTNLKTESFSYTASNNLDLSSQSIAVTNAKGFANTQSSHLIGIESAWAAWGKEVQLAQAAGLESIVLFALDQYCLIGYPPPPFVPNSRSLRQG